MSRGQRVWVIARQPIASFSFICSLALVFLMLPGCSSTSSNGKTSNTAAQAGNTVPYTPGPSHVSSKIGLGDSEKWINQHWGQPAGAGIQASQGSGIETYEQGAIEVAYLDGRATYLCITLSKPISLAQAEGSIKAYLPTDAQLESSSKGPNTDGEPVWLQSYQSDELKHLWTPMQSQNTPDGQFIVGYQYEPSKEGKLVDVLTIMLGNRFIGQVYE